MKKTSNRSRRRVPFPCGVCDKACGVDTINCDGCGVWIHRAWLDYFMRRCVAITKW